jgi:alpha-beta hydrolase superfamily lysophospholipase
MVSATGRAAYASDDMDPSADTPASIERRVPAADGTELLVREWPAPAQPVGQVLILHGLAEHSGRYENVAGWLTARGFAVHAFDQRGFGGSGGRRAWAQDVASLHEDVADGVRATRARSNGLPVVLYGHSLGGLLALGAVLGGTVEADLLVLSAPSIGANLPLVTRLAVGVLGRLAPTVELPNGLRGEQLSRDPTVGQWYVADPRNHHWTTAHLGRVLLAEVRRVNIILDRIRVPTLVIHGADDTIVPPAASEPLGRLPGVERRLYPGIRHELHNEPEGATIVGDVAAWLRQQVRAGQAPIG